MGGRGRRATDKAAERESGREVDDEVEDKVEDKVDRAAKRVDRDMLCKALRTTHIIAEYTWFLVQNYPG